MEAKDFYEMKMLERDGFSPYEQVKIGHMQSKKASGTAIAGLAVGIGAAVVGIGGWVWAGSQAKAAKDLAIAKNDGLKELVASLATTLAAERGERIEGDRTLSISINDTVSGSQQGQLSASQVATNEATAQVLTGLMTGQYSQNPIKVVRVSGQRECPCDSGCGFNG